MKQRTSETTATTFRRIEKHELSRDTIKRAAREVCDEELEYAEEISNRAVKERLEEASRDGGPSLLKRCIDGSVVNQVAVKKAKVMVERRAAVKSYVKDQISLAIKIGRSFASEHGSIPHRSEYSMPEEISDHHRSTRKNNKDSKRHSIKEDDSLPSHHSSSSSQ